MKSGLYLTLLLAHIVALAASDEAPLFFREDWKEIPFALPITAEHVSNPALRMELHGPGKMGIKKSHHAEIENDPYYVWSGRCELNWALSLKKVGEYVDLSGPDAKVRWRSRQSGEHALHLVIMLPGKRWFVSEQSDAGTTWHDHEFRISDLTWRYFSIVKATAEERVERPSLERVEEIGFTDLRVGRGSRFSSRLDWIEVYGDSVKVPRKDPPPVRSSRVPEVLPETVYAHRDLVFARYGKRELSLDLYRPKQGKGPFPAVVFIHGGGWYKGDPSSYTAMAQQLAARGYVTLNIHYRLSGEAPFPAAIHDCKSAVRWARVHAETFRIDPDRIGSLGGSAGGHLSGLLATSGEVERLNRGGSYLDQSSAVQASVVMAGNMDFTTPAALEATRTDPRRRMMIFMGGTWEESKQAYVDASPIKHVSSRTPPMLFMDGEYDRPGERSEAIKKRMAELGIYHEFHVIKNGPHPFWSLHPFFDPALELVTAFFDKTLKEKR